MVIVFGSVVIRPGLMDQALSVSLEHVRRSRLEPGCISHAVHQDCENADRLVFVEEWADQTSLQRHFAVSESRSFVEEIARLAAEEPEIVIYEATRREDVRGR